MNKTIRNILIFIIVAAFFAIIILLYKINSTLPKNPPDYIGNTAGNLYNRGLFAEDEAYIYFANPADNFRLYRMNHALEQVTRLTKDSVEYINPDAASGYLYYSRINYRLNTYGNTVFDLSSTGIYRFNLKKETLTRLYPNTCGIVFLAGNTLLYQAHGSDGDFDLCSLSVTEKKAKEVCITTDCILPVNFYHGQLYYAGVKNDHYLYTSLPTDASASLFANLDCFQPIVTNSGTYFLSQKHNYALFHLPNASDTASLLVAERLSTYNLSTDESTLFYQVDNQKNNRLCRYDIATGTETTLLTGDYKNLNTVSHYLFFTDFAETLCYCYDLSTDTVFSFMPTEKE